MSRCRSCRAEVVWAKTPANKDAPFHLDPMGRWTLVRATDGHLKAFGATMVTPAAERYTSHFATCPQADAWRKREAPR